MTTFEVYIYGMVKACETRGVDPTEFVKTAQLSALAGAGAGLAGWRQQSNYETPNWRRAQKARTWMGRGWANTKRNLGEWWADDKAEWKARTDQADQIGANEEALRRLRNQSTARAEIAKQQEEMDILQGKKKPATSSSTGGSRIPGGDIFYDPQYGRASGLRYAQTRAFLPPPSPMGNIDGSSRRAVAPPIQRPPPPPMPAAPPPAAAPVPSTPQPKPGAVTGGGNYGNNAPL